MMHTTDNSIDNIEDIKDIRISDFDYPLPDERIPRHPLAQRDACRLLVSRPDGSVDHRSFSELPSLLPHDALMVCNDTRNPPVLRSRCSSSNRSSPLIMC